MFYYVKTIKMIQFEFGTESDALFEAILSMKDKKDCEKFFKYVLLPA